MAGPIQFIKDVLRFFNKTERRKDTVLRELGFETMKDLQQTSPVDTGLFRAQWRPGVNRRDLTLTSDTDPMSDAEIKSVFAKAKWGDQLTFTNSTPYGPYLERGHSRQAPQGIYGPVMARMRMKFAKIVAELQ